MPDIKMATPTWHEVPIGQGFVSHWLYVGSIHVGSAGEDAISKTNPPAGRFSYALHLPGMTGQRGAVPTLADAKQTVESLLDGWLMRITAPTSTAKAELQIPNSPRADWVVRSRGPGTLTVRHAQSNRLVAELTLALSGRWKIVGEDTYANTPEQLLERLAKREAA